jgi:hypothetical protein
MAVAGATEKDDGENSLNKYKIVLGKESVDSAYAILMKHIQRYKKTPTPVLMAFAVGHMPRQRSNRL